jgi:hypothetical protein
VRFLDQIDSEGEYDTCEGSKRPTLFLTDSSLYMLTSLFAIPKHVMARSSGLSVDVRRRTDM